MGHLRHGRALAVGLVTLMSLGALGERARAATVYVATTGADANDGLTWETAKRTVTAGLALAVEGDQVWVASGVYVERITLKNGVGLHGGFAGHETQVAERNIRAHVTILDGGRGGSVVTAPSTVTAAARIDGFTIRNGSGVLPTGAVEGYGGGIYCDHSSPTIANNLILANVPPGTTSRGGGIYCDSASPLICGNVIAGNTADVGGGISCHNSSAPRIANNTIVANMGAGIICQSSSAPTITNNIVAFNFSGIVVTDAAPVLSHNCVYHPDGTDYSGVAAGPGDLSVDPLFVAFDHAEVHLTRASPCLDAGDDTAIESDWLDFDGQARLDLTHVDIGADEYDGMTLEFVPAIVRVSPTGDDDHSGATWETAKLTVQAAIDAIASHLGGEVWVAAGTYAQCVTLPPWVHLYGGFAGTENAREQRDLSVEVTTLEGSAGGSVVTVVSGYRVNRIDGFTIRSGSGTLSGTARCGGGVYCVRGAPIITNNTISANSAANGYGGGIYCAIYPPAIAHNTITANSALGGGGIYCASCAPSISDNTITGNTATNGGGIFCTAAAPAIANNVITGNIASGGSGGGGGIFCTSSAPSIANNTIVGNTASSGSGAGIYCQTGSAPTIANNALAANSAANGGGIGCSNASPTIANNVLAGNAAGSGGAIYCTSSSPAIINNTLIGNTATLTTSVVAGGIHCLASAPTIANNIVAFNSSGICNSGGTPALANNCVYHFGGYNYSGLSAGTGDISVDPLLLATTCGEVHLTSGSPCIDAGDDSTIQSTWTDLDGELRIQGHHVDIGADEFNGAAPAFVPRVLRVSLAGSDANDGLSWASAKATVQAAIDAALATGGEVWVAGGTYPQRITLRPRVQLYGGFAGTEETRDQRDPAANATILDGGAGGSVVTALMGWRISGLDGFTIRNGIGTLSGGNRLGGGVYCVNSAPIVANSIITANNVATGFGGGVYCSAFSAVLSRNTLSGNTAAYGGGLYCANSAVPVVSNNRIVGNTATGGGGVYCSSSAPTIANNVIAGNGANACGGLYCFSASPLIVGNTIVGNSAGDFGALYCANASSPAVSNNIVAFNSSGIHKSGGAPVLSHNCVYNPGGDDYSGLSAGTGDIAADPRLVAVDYGEIHLVAGSPCIDAGLDAAVAIGIDDIDGQPRLQAAHVDIGADESDGTTPVFSPRVIRVHRTGDDANNGFTWSAAKRTVQAAIDAAGAAGGEVWVAAGTYDECVMLRPWAYVYGGFAGNETERDCRDHRTYATILDGGAGGSVVTAQAGGRTCGIDGFILRNGTGTLSGSNRLGGGVYCLRSSPRIANNIITANTATSGGGIYCTAGSPVITANTITGNNATTGGGIACSTASAVISGNLITANAVTSGNGGGIHCSSMSPTITDNRIVRNTAASSHGGGVYCSAAATLTGNVIAGNVAVNGAAIYCASASPKITNTVIVGNRATAFGGAMYNLSSSPTITNCTFAANRAAATSGLHNNASSPALANCILWAHTGTLIANLSNSSPTYHHCDVQTTVTGTGNINLDPLFKRSPAAGPDAIWGTADDDYGDLHLRSGSPCIDAGSNSAVPSGTLTDPDGQARFINDLLTADCSFAAGTCGTAPIVDMGAFEFAIPGDVDHDGDVDKADREALAACLAGPARSRPEGCASADFDRDGDVDQTDFGVWQRCFRGPGQAIDPGCDS